MPLTAATAASLVAMITSIVAMLGLIFQLWRSAITLQAQALLDLEKRFYSEEMRAVRRAAARKLLSGTHPNAELEDVLDFLHNVVTLVEQRVINRSLAFEYYKYWLARYWLVAKEYVERLRKDDDPTTYRKLQLVAERIAQAGVGVNYSPEAMQVFLQKEAGIGSPQEAA